MPGFGGAWGANLNIQDRTATGPLPVLIGAVTERARAHWWRGTDGLDVSGPETNIYSVLQVVDPVAPSLVIGDTVNLALLLGNLQGTIGHMLEGYQGGPVWLDHRGDPFTGLTPNLWTLPNIRSAAGLPLTRRYSRPVGFPVTGPLELDDSRDGCLFLRKRDRRVAWYDAVEDDQGNPAIAGQRAWGPGGLVLCHASGDWRRDHTPGLAPDLLTNTQAPPDAVAEPVGVHGSDGFFFGVTQPGDIVAGPNGLHVWNEIRRIVNLLRWTYRKPTGGGIGHPQLFHRGLALRNTSFGPDNTGTTFAAAVAAHDAAWAALDPGTSDDEPPADAGGPAAWHSMAALPDAWGSAAWIDADNSGDESEGDYFLVRGSRFAVRFYVPMLAEGISRTIKWYVSAVAPTAVTGDYDPGADPLPPAVAGLVEWAVTGPNDGSIQSSPWLGDIDVPPPAPEPAVIGDSGAAGYAVTDVMAVIDWEGFQYVE